MSVLKTRPTGIARGLLPRKSFQSYYTPPLSPLSSPFSPSSFSSSSSSSSSSPSSSSTAARGETVSTGKQPGGKRHGASGSPSNQDRINGIPPNIRVSSTIQKTHRNFAQRDYQSGLTGTRAISPPLPP